MQKLALLLFLCLCSLGSLNAQSLISEPAPQGTFKAMPGTKEWKSFTSRTQMINATSLSSDELKQTSTADLVKICLNWPLYSDLFVFNSLQTGMERLIQDYNGLSELISRADAGTELLKAYDQIAPSQVGSMSDLVEQGRFSLQVAYLEMILSHPSVLAQMSQAERLELIRSSLDHYYSAHQYPEVFSSLNDNTMGLLMARSVQMNAPELLRGATDKADWLDGFLHGKDAISSEAVALIVQQAELLLAESK